jgi:spermidine dehydrogenase
MSSISRRDFLNGAALIIAAGLTPRPGRGAAGALSARAHRAARPAPGSFEAAHARAYERGRYQSAPHRSRSATISWSVPASAACGRLFFTARRRAIRPHPRPRQPRRYGVCQANEFTSTAASCRYGGSESIDSPRTHYSDVAKALLFELGVEIDRFESAFDRKFYASRGLARGVFFPREAFGRDVLVPGEPASGGADELARALANAKPLASYRGVSNRAGEQGATARAL